MLRRTFALVPAALAGCLLLPAPPALAGTPTVTITAPVAASSISGKVEIAVHTEVSNKVNERESVNGVDISINGRTSLWATQRPLGSQDFYATWDTSDLPDGTYVLGAAAQTNYSGYDGRGFAEPVSVTVDNPDPTVSILTPSADSVLRQEYTDIVIRAAAAADTTSTITRVDLYDSGELLGTNTGATQPYSFRWQTGEVTPGGHTLTAVATDSGGRTATSAPVTVRVPQHIGEFHFGVEVPQETYMAPVQTGGHLFDTSSRPLADQLISIQARPHGQSAFSDIGTATTTEDGEYFHEVRLAARTELRAVYDGTVSAPRTVTITPRISVKSSARSGKVGVFSGAVAPKRAVVVKVQASNGRVLARATSNASGTFNVRVPLLVGTQTYKLVTAAGAGLTEGVTRTKATLPNGITAAALRAEAARQWKAAYRTNITGVRCSSGTSTPVAHLPLDSHFECRVNGPSGQFTQAFTTVTSRSPFFHLILLTD